MKTNRYAVLVGNIGWVHRGSDEIEARRHYREYCEQSETGYGRAAGEPVTLWLEDEPIESFEPTAKDRS